MPLTNAPFIVNEIATALHKLLNERSPTTIFLSQSPMTEEDAAFLSDFLGRGETLIEIGGLSQTRFRATRYPGVWWGEYSTAPGNISLRTIDVAEVPELVHASRDDINDGLGRLRIGLPGLQCTKQD